MTAFFLLLLLPYLANVAVSDGDGEQADGGVAVAVGVARVLEVEDLLGRALGRCVATVLDWRTIKRKLDMAFFTTLALLVLLTEAADPEAGGAGPAGPASLTLALGGRVAGPGATGAVGGGVAYVVRELDDVEQAENWKRKVKYG